jgi:hypothetical protein
MVNPDDECPHPSGKVYYREDDSDKVYEASYDADEATTEYSGHHHGLVNPGCGHGRVRGVLNTAFGNFGAVSITIPGTTFDVTITNATSSGLSEWRAPAAHTRDWTLTHRRLCPAFACRCWSGELFQCDPQE